MSKNDMPVHRITVAVIGDGAVGKSSIVQRFVDGGIRTRHDPTIEDSFVKTIAINGSVIPVVIMDTSGQEEYLPLVDTTINSADCCMLVFDLGNLASFNAIPRYMQKIHSVRSTGKAVPVVLVGNKSDRSETSVTDQQLVQLATKLQINYFKTSALRNENVSAVFEYLVELCINHQPPLDEGCCSIL